MMLYEPNHYRKISSHKNIKPSMTVRSCYGSGLVHMQVTGVSPERQVCHATIYPY